MHAYARSALRDFHMTSPVACAHLGSHVCAPALSMAAPDGQAASTTPHQIKDAAELAIAAVLASFRMAAPVLAQTTALTSSACQAS